MNKIIASIIAALLLAVPYTIAADDWYYNNPYGESGRSYESYQRTYDTTRSDIASRNIANTNTMANSGYSGYPGYPYSYNGYYQYNPGNTYYSGALGYPYYGGSNSYTNTYSDNYNHQYTEKTNEVIKVDKYVAYDNQGMYYPTYGSEYGPHHPYYYSVVNNDAYGYRYPYAGYSTGDTGYYAQPYYSTTSPQEIVIRIPDYTTANMPNGSTPTIVCPSNRQVSVLQLTKSADGPSQTYGNAIVDRGAISVQQRPTIRQVNLQNSVTRNPCDTSLYTRSSQRDTMYVQAYTRN